MQESDDRNGRSLTTVFSRVAQWSARECGRAHTFVGAGLVILVWGATGPLFHYSDTWQLIINTGTTIVTFMMVFLMQNTQNREKARNRMLSLEDLTEEQLDQLKAGFVRLADVPEKAQHELQEARDELAEVGEKVDDAQEKLATVETIARRKVQRR